LALALKYNVTFQQYCGVDLCNANWFLKHGNQLELCQYGENIC